jgi:hypothetical protein
VQVHVAAPEAREEERRVETRRQRVEGLEDALAERDPPPRAHRLAAVVQLAAGEGAADVDDALGPVEVTPLEREPLLGAETRPGGEDHERPVGPISSATASTSAHVSKGRISSRFGSGLGTSLAGSADPTSRMRDIAEDVGITERAAAQIVNDLVAAGYLTKTRDGRRNLYEVHRELPIRHPRHRHRTVGDLIDFLET